MRIAIIGTGPMAQGLCALATRSGAISGGALEVRLCSRRAEPGGEAFLDGLPMTPITNTSEALQWCDVVVLAVPASQLVALCGTYGEVIGTKVVVDITNPSRADIAAMNAASSAGGSPRNSDDTAVSSVEVAVASPKRKDSFSSSASPTSAARALVALLMKDAAGKCAPGGNYALPAVVKSLNNISAYSLLHSDPLVDVIKTVATSDCPEAAKTVSQMLQYMGIECRVVGSLGYATRMEGWHRELFPGWQMPTLLMGITWLLMEVFTAIRYNHYDHNPWYNMTMWVTNKALAWASLWGLLYCYLPGLIISYIQLVRRVSSFKLWRWVQRWMDARKQIGLLSLLLMVLHLALSTYLWMPAYYSKLWVPEQNLALGVGPAAKVDKFGLAATASLPKQAINITAQLITVNGSSIAAAASRLVAKSAPTITLRSRLNWQGEASMLIGILAGVAMGLVGMTSMPSITHRLNWREWLLAQSWMGWLSFCLATAHTLIL